MIALSFFMGLGFIGGWWFYHLGHDAPEPCEVPSSGPTTTLGVGEHLLPLWTLGEEL